MRVKDLFVSAFLFVFTLGMAGCGGGGGGAAPAGVSGFSKGVITAKGSVTVNGVKFDSSKKGMVRFENISGLNDDMLKVGMVVKIKGKIDDASKTGTAEKIEFTDNLEGSVTSKDPVAKTLVIFGQTVRVDSTTVFEGFAGFDDPALTVGSRVEVSGFPDSTGKILATRIENKTGATDDFEIKGTVSGFTAGGTTFTLTPPNSTAVLNVTLGAGVTLPTGFDNGKFVEVRTTGSGTAITATKVELEDELKADDKDRVEVEGLVTSVDTTLKTFVVNGITVDASAMTMPTVGQKVEVEGTLVNGKLVPAKQMEVEKESTVKLEGNVATAADIDLVNKTIKLNGVTVSTNSTTLFRDSDSSGGKTPVVNFSLADIAVGNHLEIAGFLDAGGKVIATRLERMQGTKTIVQGPVSAKTTPNLTILGVTIATGATTQYKKSDGTAFADQAAFFAAVTPGTTVVKARGTFTAPSTLDTNVANGEVEIEL